MNDEPVGTVIETEEIYGHTFKKRKSKIVQWLKKVDVGTLLYVNPSKEDEGKVCARCGAIAYDPVITHPVKELSGVEIIGMSGKYDFTYEVDIIDFVRACLRKAQEKPSSKCGDSYDTVCPPSICDCQGKEQEK